MCVTTEQIGPFLCIETPPPSSKKPSTRFPVLLARYLEENVAALSVQLTPEELKHLGKTFAPEKVRLKQRLSIVAVMMARNPSHDLLVVANLLLLPRRLKSTTNQDSDSIYMCPSSLDQTGKSPIKPAVKPCRRSTG